MTAKLPSLSSRDVVRFLKENGFSESRQRGSHLLLFHSDGRRATVPVGRQDIPPGTLKSILKEAGLEQELRDRYQ